MLTFDHALNSDSNTLAARMAQNTPGKDQPLDPATTVEAIQRSNLPVTMIG